MGHLEAAIQMSHLYLIVLFWYDLPLFIIMFPIQIFFYQIKSNMALDLFMVAYYHEAMWIMILILNYFVMEYSVLHNSRFACYNCVSYTIIPVENKTFGSSLSGPKCEVRKVRRNLFAGGGSLAVGSGMERRQSVAVMEGITQPPSTPPRRKQGSKTLHTPKCEYQWTMRSFTFIFNSLRPSDAYMHR